MSYIYIHASSSSINIKKSIKIKKKKEKTPKSQIGLLLRELYSTSHSHQCCMHGRANATHILLINLFTFDKSNKIPSDIAWWDTRMWWSANFFFIFHLLRLWPTCLPMPFFIYFFFLKKWHFHSHYYFVSTFPCHSITWKFKRISTTFILLQNL